jgi:hypothetical protein
MPPPRLVVALCCQTDRARDAQLQDIEAILGMVYLGQQLALAIEDVEDTAVDRHLAAPLVQLADADDVFAELGDVVDIRRCSVLPRLAVEEDCPTTTNVHGGVVAELDCADNTGVELGEGLAISRHVVARARFEVPQLLCFAAFLAQIDLRTCFIEHNARAGPPLLQR